MGVCGNVCCVAAVVKNSAFFSLGVLKYVVCLCRGCDGCCVFCLYCEAWSCRCFLISVCMFIVSKALLISSATVIVRAGGAIWLNPFATVLFSVCSAVTVECCVLYPCCMGVFGMFSVM